MYEDEIIEQLGVFIESFIRSCYTSNTMDTVQTTLIPPNLQTSQRPTEKKLQEKEKIRINDNIRIDDIWKGQKCKQLDAFASVEKTRPLHPTAQILLAELRKNASNLRGIFSLIF